MPAEAVTRAPSRIATYRRRQPERTVLYRAVQSHLATWLELAQVPAIEPGATDEPSAPSAPAFRSC